MVIPLMNKEILINDFAIRSFRDVADYDYIAARLAYRAKLVPQFLWSSQQAIEKYLKCILLLNRVKAKHVRHDLNAALKLIQKHCHFKLSMQDSTYEFIKYIDTYGQVRYLDTPFYATGLAIMKLDKTVWDIRRYCRTLNYWGRLQNGEIKQMSNIELPIIEQSENLPPHAFKIMDGALEKIIHNKKHPAREPLLWQNPFFGQRTRKTVRLSLYSHSTNSPLSLHPEILDDITEYVRIPDKVAKESRRVLSQSSTKKRVTRQT